MRRPVNFLNALLFSITAILMLGLPVTAPAQQLDYTIVKSFQAKYDSIKSAIRQAKTVQDCAEISANINELEKHYAADTTLLNKALYPDNYDVEINNVRVNLRLAQDKLGIIESQVARITDLESQVRTLSSKVDSLSTANDKLMASLDVVTKAMVKNRNMIDSLNRIIGQLRYGLRERDAAIFALVDSMFMQYGNKVQGLPEQERNTLTRKVARHNVIAEIHRAAVQNLKFLETTQLTGKDLLQMVQEQRKFNSYWEGIGPRLSNLYLNSRERIREITAIDSVISQWGTKADSLLWVGVYKEFKDNNVPVDSFSNANQFVTSLGEYFDTQGGSLKASAAERASRLNYFLKNVWEPNVGTQWLPMMVDEGILTKTQENVLENKLMNWRNASKPSYVLLYVVIILIIIGIVVFFMKKRKKSPMQLPSQN